MKKGEECAVVESCGMLVLAGRFLGVATYVPTYDRFMVFENITPGKNGYKYFGARYVKSQEHDPTINRMHLRSCYYGDTIEGLKPVGYAHVKEMIQFTPAEEDENTTNTTTNDGDLSS